MSIVVTPAYGMESIEEDNRYWIGEELKYDVGTENSNAELYINDSDVDSQFVTELVINESGFVSFDTDGYDANEYRLEYDSGDVTKEVIFDISKHELDVEYNSSDVNNVLNPIAEVEYDSNKVEYNINVSSEDLGDSELSDIFGYDESDVYDGELNIDRSDNANFDDISGGEYNITYNATGTSAKDTVMIEVVSGNTDGTISFNKSVYELTRGSKVDFEVEFNGVDETEIHIGDKDDTGYELNFTLEDTSSDGSVTLTFNTYKAGLGNQEYPISVKDSSEGDITVNDETEIGIDRLAALDYTLESTVNDNTVELSTISVNEIGIEKLETYAYPSDTIVDDIDDINISSNKVSSHVAKNDQLIVSIDGDISPFIDTNNIDDLETDSFSLKIMSNQANSDEAVDIDETEIYINENNSKTYIVKDVTTSDFDIGDDYKVELEITEDSDYIENESQEVEIEKELEIEDRETEFNNYNSEYNRIELTEGENLTIETNIANGTEREIVINRENKSKLLTYEKTVNNGKIKLDVSDSIEVGSEFTVKVLKETSEYDGKIIKEVDVPDEDDDLDDKDDEENNNTTDEPELDDDNSTGDTDIPNNDTEDQNNTDNDTNNDTDNNQNDNGGIIQSIKSFINSLF